MRHAAGLAPAGIAFTAEDPRPGARRCRDQARFEHVFAVQKQAMGLAVRTIGLARASTRIGMANRAYNLWRIVQLESRVTA